MQPVDAPAWRIVADQLGGRDLLERRGPGAVVMRYRPAGRGGAAEVSIDGGKTWRAVARSVPSLRFAELACNALVACWRAELATRANPRGPSVAERVGLREESESADGADGAERATRAPGAARAARRDETEEASRRGERRSGDDPAPPWARFDDAEAAELAREYVTTALDRSVAGKRGDDALFRVAVAIVRGFCLYPDGAAAIVLDQWNRTEAIPPWPAQRLRRALERAERIGRLPWGVLLSTTPRGRELVGRWMRETRSAGGRGAGKGARP